MWVDLEDDLEELFSDMRHERDVTGMFVRRFDTFADPHADADEWLTATPESRAAMAPRFEAKLALRRQESARALVRVLAQRAPDKRTPEQHRIRTRLYLEEKRKDPAWRARERARDAARRLARTPEQRERRNARKREVRAMKKEAA